MKLQAASQSVAAHAWAWLVGGGLAVLGAFVIVIQFIARSVAKEVIEMHNADELAHKAAAEHNHGPMNDKLDLVLAELQGLREEFAGLKSAHEVIVGMKSGRLCVRSTDPPNAVFERKGDPE